MKLTWRDLDQKRARQIGFYLERRATDGGCLDGGYRIRHLHKDWYVDGKSVFRTDREAAEYCMFVAWGDVDKSTVRTQVCKKAVLMCCIGD